MSPTPSPSRFADTCGVRPPGKGAHPPPVRPRHPCRPSAPGGAPTTLREVAQITARTLFQRTQAYEATIGRRQDDIAVMRARVAARAVLARLGPKATALARPERASALNILRPSQSRYVWPGSGLAWPRPRLLYEEYDTTRQIWQVLFCMHLAKHDRTDSFQM